MIAVADREREVGGRQRSQAVARNAGRQEKRIGMGGNVAAGAARMCRVEEFALRKGIDVGREGVEITLIAGLVGPAGEFDACFVGRVAARHPFRFRDAKLIEEGLELRRRAFTDPDDSDRGGLDQRDPRAMFAPMPVEQVGGHPAGRPATEDDDRPRWFHRAVAMSTSPARGWSEMILLTGRAP